MYFLAVFSFGLAGDLAARQSIYPARMFTLPVTTAALAGWPMLYGAAAMASLWLATALSRTVAVGIDLAAGLAGAAGRGVSRLDAGADVDAVRSAGAARDRRRAVAGVARRRRAPGDPLRSARAADGRLPGAAASARVSRRLLRRGAGSPRRRARLARDCSPVAGRMPPRRRDHFVFARPRATVVRVAAARLVAAGAGGHRCCRSSWRCCSWPATTRRVRLLHSARPCCSRRRSWPASPPRRSSKANPDARDSYGVTPFMATRPMTSAALVAAKLKVAIWSTLAAWLLVLVAIPLGAHAVGHLAGGDRTARRRVIEAVGTPRAIVVVLLGFLGLLAIDVEAARAEPVHRPDRPRMARQVERACSPCRSSSSSGRSLNGSSSNGACRPRCWTRCRGSSPSWSASRCPPRPGSPRASIAAGCSATARS